MKASLVAGDFCQSSLSSHSSPGARVTISGQDLPARRAQRDARPGETQRGVFPAETRGNRISSYRCRCLRPCLCLMYRIRGRYLPRHGFSHFCCLFSPQMGDFNLYDWLLIPRDKSSYSLWDIHYRLSVCGSVHI